MAAALVVSRTALIGAGASHSLGVKSPLTRVRSAYPKPLTFASWKQYMVRCDAEGNEAVGSKDAEEQGVKKTISKLDDLLKTTRSNDSTKKLGFGTNPNPEPVDTTPEVESTPAVDDLDFAALFALNEPLPEILSGRLAMVGMAWALVAEKATGLTVYEQMFTHGKLGLVFFVGVVQLLTYASLTPITKGESTDSRSLGPFTPRAERWIGRLAMVGFLSLIVTEALHHAPIFQ